MMAFAPIRFGHGPDADDAFVFEPLIHGRVPTRGLVFRNSHLSFDDLNRRAAGDDPFEVTMLSAAALARHTDRWLALPFGGSFVRTMGPTLVARRAMRLHEARHALVAIPGEDTTATLLLRLFAPEARTMVVPYAEVAAAVAEGTVDAGVVIHEQQLDFHRHGLVKIVDLGRRWMRIHGLPTPLAVCAVRADLPARLRSRIVDVLRSSVLDARRSPEAPQAFSRQFDGGLGDEAADLLVAEYVSDDTYSLGRRARSAIELLVAQAQALDRKPELVFAESTHVVPLGTPTTEI